MDEYCECVAEQAEELPQTLAFQEQASRNFGSLPPSYTHIKNKG